MKEKFNLEKVNITDAEESDLERILEIQLKAYISEAVNCNDFDIPPLKSDLKEMKQESESKKIFKAIYINKIVGSVRGYEKDGVVFIEKLITDNEYQNLGIGKKLLKHIEDYFKNAKKYELFTGSKSIKNIEFYKKAGYAVYKEEKVNKNYGIVYMKKESREVIV